MVLAWLKAEKTQAEFALALKRTVAGAVVAAEFRKQRHHMPEEIRTTARASLSPTLFGALLMLRTRCKAGRGKR
jgi:hypothetical protein